MAKETISSWLCTSFEQALRVDDDAAHRPRMRLAVLVWSFAILVVVSFTMLWMGDKINASGMVVTRFMARAQAPLTAQFMYPARARDQITVVMYDQAFLKSNAAAWPISYQDHADWLLRLAGDPNARPRAILLDVSFGQGRGDPTLPALKQALCTVQNEFKVPVFLAAMPSADTGRLTIRAGLAADTAKGEPACFTLVGVDYLPDPLDGLAWNYPLSRHRTDTGWQPGPAHGSGQPSYRSAAMTMAEDVAHIDLGEEDEPMSLVWGYNSAPQTGVPERPQDCVPGVPRWQNLVPPIVRQLWDKPPGSPLCPYHRTLSMGQLGELDEQQLAPYLAGRYVLVGANIPGYNDFVNSPVHRLVPGVHLHAMALDNFLTYRGDYKLASEWTVPPSAALLAPGLLTILAVLVVRLAWTRVLHRFFSLERWSGRYSRDSRPGRMRRIGRQLLGALAWLLRLTLQGIAAMVLIALLQRYFRIGMLPVVELVGMTLVAEGFSYMRKLRQFIYGSADAGAPHAVQT